MSLAATSGMGSCVRAVTISALFVLPISALAGDPSASIPSDSAGRWEGTATELQGIYSGPARAKIPLDLTPDGAVAATWKEAALTWATSGTRPEHGKATVR